MNCVKLIYMKKEDFIFTVGSYDNVVIVDKTLKRKYRTKTSRQLADIGLYKPAFCAAFFDRETGAGSGQSDLEYLLSVINKNESCHYASVDVLNRLFGVFSVPQNVRIKLI